MPDIKTLGPEQVCEIELRWVDTETMEGKLATIPVNVNVVPGDQAAGRVRDSEVETELTFQTVQREKQQAAEDMARGDYGSARMRMASSSQRLRGTDRSRMSNANISEYEQEQLFLEERMAQIDSDPNRARKMTKSDYIRKHRRRGRGPTGED